MFRKNACDLLLVGNVVQSCHGHEKILQFTGRLKDNKHSSLFGHLGPGVWDRSREENAITDGQIESFATQLEQIRAFQDVENLVLEMMGVQRRSPTLRERSLFENCQLSTVVCAGYFDVDLIGIDPL